MMKVSFRSFLPAVILMILLGGFGFRALSDDRSPVKPIVYVGQAQPDKHYYDGALRYAVGVHQYQAMRANREHPSPPGKVGWTYNHQPYLCYWNDQFYLQYLSDPVGEHEPPGRTLIMTSPDGRHWSEPRVVFPVYPLPKLERQGYPVPEGTPALMHQRMGWYVAPNDRLLTLGFYGISPTPRHGPNKGDGIGRVVREVGKDGSLGPIYFIRYNRHAGFNESNTRYPFYKTSPDPGFVQACDALLADKLMVMQWWEEDRGKDGFFALENPSEEVKAFSWFKRADGVTVGLWKASWMAFSPDDGKTWSELVQAPTLHTCNAKIWGQRTEDGKYALVYNHSATRRNRFPLIVMTSDDGKTFDNMLVVDGEVPPVRYQGIHKNRGPQYIRGILPGSGNPPGDHLWNTYSVNKEDIWVSRTTVPITGLVREHVNENFDQRLSEADLQDWNLYIPKWAPISIVGHPSGANKSLELRDEEPYDYAIAQRAFPVSGKVTISFRAKVQTDEGVPLVFEVQNEKGKIPVRLRLDRDWLMMDILGTDPKPVAISGKDWMEITVRMDCGRKRYDLALDGEWVRRDIEYAMDTETVERMVFRTGPYRGLVDPLIVDREPGTGGLDRETLPGAGEKAPLSVFLIDDVKTLGE